EAEEREHVSSDDSAPQQPRDENREGGERKRRRRRRGRDRNRDRGDRPQTLQEPIPSSPALHADQADGDAEDGASQDGAHDDAAHADPQNGQPPGEGQRKRRRRRRGRRGRRDGEGQFRPQNGNAENGETGIAVETTHAPVTPNSDSTPSWSLGSGHSEPARASDAEKPAAIPETPAQPVRKGWWQRTFASKD
ncbi:MAG TPA: hypothetical protein VL971_07620, partial [Rhizomicrobium sp.]|nr:hypothetical protein [Rhizomicrobium sp.]